jgi:hypothetical protein
MYGWYLNQPGTSFLHPILFVVLSLYCESMAGASTAAKNIRRTASLLICIPGCFMLY